MRHALVFGGSGQIGQPLLARLLAGGWRVGAVSRQPHTDAPGLAWMHGDLQQFGAAPADADTLISCGPLDHFAHWYAHNDARAARVIAFGSTSIDSKQDSADAGERRLAARLQAAEAQLFDSARARGAAATVLRPTLVYGAGRDANLTRIATLARHYGWFALPGGACGRRQPVHVEDLADAVMAALDAPASHGRAYALPGGETLPYRDMVARVLACLRPRPRLVELPPPLFALLLRLARLAGRAGGFGDAALARLREDLVFDADPARRDFGYAPRRFEPEPQMLGGE